MAVMLGLLIVHGLLVSAAVSMEYHGFNFFVLELRPDEMAGESDVQLRVRECRCHDL